MIDFLGLKRLNWNSLGILDFANRCNSALGTFEGVLNMVHKNAVDIEAFLANISSASLFSRKPEKKQQVRIDDHEDDDGNNDREIAVTPLSPAAECPAESEDKGAPTVADADEPLMDAKEFLSAVEQHRQNTVAVLVAGYDTIGPLLEKVSTTVIGSRQKQHPYLIPYYHHWEVKMFHALTEMVAANLKLIKTALVKREPLFSVDIWLSAPEVVLMPTTNELHQLLQTMLSNILESTKQFQRWMHGTCELTPPLYIAGEEEAVIFSFFDDVAQNVEIAQLQNECYQSTMTMFDRVGRHLNPWKQYRPVIHK